MKNGIVSNVYFESWDANQKRFLFQRNGKHFWFQNADFLRWGNLADFSATESCLVLNDGSVFVGIPLKTQSNSKNFSETLEWENSLFGTISIPVAEVAGILLNTQTARQRERLLRELNELQKSKKKRSSDDLLIFRTGERLEGEFLSLDGDALLFRTRELSPTSDKLFLPTLRELKVSLTQLAALFFSTKFRSESSLETYFWIGLSDGSIFRINPEGKRPALGKIPMETILYLEPSQHSLRFLDSSEKAITSATAPILELRWLDEIAPTEGAESWHSQATPTGNRLRAGKAIYRRGFSAPVGTSLLWKLDETYTTLGMIPVLSTKMDSTSSQVKLRIFSGESLVHESVLEREIAPKSLKLLQIPLNGSLELRLETEAVQPTSGNLLLPARGDVFFLDAFLVPRTE